MCKAIAGFIKKLFVGTEAEEDEYLGGFRHLSQAQIKHILKVINEEIQKSRESFGFKLRPEDEKKEKVAILTLFNEFGQSLYDKGKEIDNHRYESQIRIMIGFILKILEKEVEYYFDNTPAGETRTRYNCHLESVTTRLVKDFLDARAPL